MIIFDHYSDIIQQKKASEMSLVKMWHISGSSLVQFHLICMALLTIDLVSKQRYRNADINLDPESANQR